MGYEEWAPWSPCTKTCDMGRKRRYRNCLLEPARCTKTEDEIDCNTFQCPSEFNVHNKLFDLNKGDRYGLQTWLIVFFYISYIVHGDWGSWSEYEPCDRTCGFGSELRKRVCNNPEPQFEGRYCPGTDKEFIYGCNPYPCPSKILNRVLEKLFSG